MPFDATDRPAPPPHELYAERRRRAAALWATVPEAAFDADRWLNRETPCGTTACAIGWLALLEHDGWRVVAALPYHPDYAHTDDVYVRAARYFGLSWYDALVLFGTSSWRTKTVTLAELAAQLLAAPLPCSVAEKEAVAIPVTVTVTP